METIHVQWEKGHVGVGEYMFVAKGIVDGNHH
jgi:hypothetical protein